MKLNRGQETLCYELKSMHSRLISMRTKYFKLTDEENFNKKIAKHLGELITETENNYKEIEKSCKEEK